MKKFIFISMLLLAPLMAEATVCQQKCNISTALDGSYTRDLNFFWDVPNATTWEDCLPPPTKVRYATSITSTATGYTIYLDSGTTYSSIIDC